MKDEKITAEKFLELILEGINPITGEIIPENSALKESELLSLIENFLKTYKHPYFFNGTFHYGFNSYKQKLKESPNRSNAYNKWETEEDNELEILSKTKKIKELSDHFKRQPGAIKSRLKKLGISPQNSSFINEEAIAYCIECGAEFNVKRKVLGFKTCLNCGEKEALKVTPKIDEGIAGTREENKKMRAQVWGEIRNRSRGRD